MLRKIVWLSSVGFVLLNLGACSRATKRPVAQQSPVVVASSPSGQSPARQSESLSAKPAAPAATRPVGGQLARVPGLIPSTRPESRLSQGNGGRRDPFATTVLPSVTVQPVAEGTAPPPLPAVTAVVNPQPIPIPGMLPPPPPLAITAPYGQPVAVAASPSPQPVIVTAPAPERTLRINGVVQVGNQFSAIVEDSLDRSTRSVAAGDYLGIGNLRVKQIRLGASREPIVVLERNGKEFIQSVGSPIPISI